MLARKKLIKPKTDQISRDAQPTQIPITESQLWGILAIWNFAFS